jgi:di/tricarboxylate transporter
MNIPEKNISFCPCNSTFQDENLLWSFFLNTNIQHGQQPEHQIDNYDMTRTLQTLESTPGEEQSENAVGETWQIIYVSLVLLYMFGALISDRVGADMVMVSALALLMASQIISVQEGLAGFANEGLLTVLVLFVVAAGISHTGALDWYMGKLLGRPKNVASAQLRLMLPIAFISAFLNNTPVVVVMIPIVQRWGQNVGISPQQLLMPLSFAR